MLNLYAATFGDSIFLIIIILVLIPVVAGAVKMASIKKMNSDLEKNDGDFKQQMLTYGALATIKTTFAKGDPNFKYNHDYQLYASDKMLVIVEEESGNDSFIDYDNIVSFKLTEVKEKVMSNPAYGGSRPVDNSRFMADIVYTDAEGKKWHPLFCINSNQKQVTFNDYATAEANIFETVKEKIKKPAITEK